MFAEENMEKIYTLYNELMNIKSDTGTREEKAIATYIHKWLSELDYFKKHPDHLENNLIPDDPFGRSVVTALVKGKGERTVILLHHHDAVDIFEYGTMAPYAFDSDKLKEALRTIKHSDEIMSDLNDEQWLFGRGSADMKSGAAVQMTLTEEFAKKYLSLSGNILFLSVCDEENLSAGMRYATSLLNHLKDKHKLDYITAINSEPVSKNKKGHLKIYEGTVGKAMPTIYIRGRKAHVGEVFKGFNPLLPLSHIHTEVEHNSCFTDVYNGEVTPPPTWVYMRDQKKMYDVSIPESAAAYFSVLSLHKTPKEIMKHLLSIANDAFDKSIIRYNESLESYNHKAVEQVEGLYLKPLVYTFEQVINKAESLDHEFINNYKSEVKTIKDKIDFGQITVQEGTLSLIEFTVDHLDHQDPIIVIAFAAPLYPFVSNINSKADIPDYLEILNNYAKLHGYTEYSSSNYFMGICDFSYMSYNMADDDLNYIKDNMPGWGQIYTLPIEDLKALDIPVINIGPWGKDLHKITERVHKESAFVVLPKVMEHLINSII